MCKTKWEQNYGTTFEWKFFFRSVACVQFSTPSHKFGILVSRKRRINKMDMRHAFKESPTFHSRICEQTPSHPSLGLGKIPKKSSSKYTRLLDLEKLYIGRGAQKIFEFGPLYMGFKRSTERSEMKVVTLILKKQNLGTWKNSELSPILAMKLIKVPNSFSNNIGCRHRNVNSISNRNSALVIQFVLLPIPKFEIREPQKERVNQIFNVWNKTELHVIKIKA